MNPTRTIRRLATILAGLAAAALAFAAAAPAALARPVPPDPGPPGIAPAPAIHTVVVGGMPGWQITLIAVAAAALAAGLALLLARAWAARRHPLAPTA
jgi:ABC-type sugar transport system substrate-binding protein